MKCLITGIDGFTGGYLKKKLLNINYEVYGTSFVENKDHSVFQCDITKKNEILYVLDQVKPDFIFHLAAISFVKSDPLKIYNTNVIGTLNLLNCLVELNISPKKIIIPSSAVVYGNREGILSETTSLKPVNHYGNSKLVMENMAINYFNKLNIIITRPFNYTGIGQNIKF
ncbi:GDP-mannose 4,6-dehydratase, partial [Flavobacteriaceae bacterium]|nr:GDP-mannose 4,6-dehydratase [Flavobacteriaceae bacterium]